jgi:hypothetical protein
MIIIKKTICQHGVSNAGNVETPQPKTAKESSVFVY